MGYTSSTRYNTMSLKENIIHQEGLDPKKIKAYCTGGGAHYFAYETDNGLVIALIILASTRKGELSTKIMEESMGPYNSAAKSSFLKVLSPLEQLYTPGTHSFEWASAWRERCEAYHSKQSETFNAGDRIRVTPELSFTNGFKGQDFVLVQDKSSIRRKLNFLSLDSGMLFRVSGGMRSLLRRGYTIERLSS